MSDRLDRFFADVLDEMLRDMPEAARARARADRLWPDETTRARAEAEAEHRLRVVEAAERSAPVRGVQRALFGGGG